MYKAQLLSCLEKVLSDYRAAEAELKRFFENKEGYTDVVIELNYDSVLSQLTEKMRINRANFNSILKRAEDAINERWVAKIEKRDSDAAYQVKLQNDIRSLELGAITKKYEVMQLIKRYKDDIIALRCINKAIENGDNAEIKLATDFLTSMPADAREKNIKMLNQMSASIDRFAYPERWMFDAKYFAKYADPPTEYRFGYELHLQGFIDGVKEKYNDDLEFQESFDEFDVWVNSDALYRKEEVKMDMDFSGGWANVNKKK